MENKNKFFNFLLIFSLLGNIVLIYQLSQLQQVVKDSSSASFPLLSLNENMPIDSNQDGNSKEILHYQDLKDRIDQKILFYNSEGSSNNVSVYIQDAQKGSWMGVKEEEGFVPASLLKVPIALAIMKEIEQGELSLSQEIAIENGDIDIFSGDPDRFHVGKSASIRSLLEAMLKISDNTAKNVLKRQLSEDEINSVFVHIGINNPYLEDNDDKLVTTRQFSRIFKALYFSTYLRPENSEMILELLTDTREESLISAGVPSGVQVAHKYGERSNALHDCGIVYDDKNPYFVCIMTKNIDVKNAQMLIKDISSETYQYITENE